VVVGHVDAGKSTLVGRLMSSVCDKTKRDIEKRKGDALNTKQESFLFAWNTDCMKDEKERGITIDYNEKTIDITEIYIQSNNIKLQKGSTSDFQVTFYDCPGHKDFVSNMIGGVSNADAALLVIDCTDFIG